MFTHLHVHSDNSILNGVIKADKIVKKAKSLGMKSVALTDNGVMYGVFKFYMACKEEGVKPIIGAQVNVAPRTRFEKEHKVDEKTSELVLLAKNLTGYHNLMKVVSYGHLEGFYYKSRVDKEILEKFSEGLICLSGGGFGEIGRKLYLGDNEKARDLAKYYKELYGDDFYLEIQRTGIHAQDVINPKLVEVSNKLGIKLVATNDVYYENKDDFEVREVLWAIDSGRVLSDPSRRKPESEENYFRSEEEMRDLFKDLPEAVDNTGLIEEKIEEYDIGFGIVQPVYPDIPENETEESYLKKLVFEKAEERFGYFNKDLEDRLNQELGIIHDKGYDGYFLVMWSIVNHARSNKIMVSTRGSAAGSAVSYTLGITTVDPIKWGLFFERFLNPERKSLPDIDLDIADNRRDEVIDWVTQKYGEQCVSNVGAFGKLTTKAAIRDVGRVLDIELSIIDRLSKLVPVRFGKVLSIKACVSDDEADDKEKGVINDFKAQIDEFREIIKSDKRFEKLVKYVKKIEGCSRHVSTHACGYLITSPAPLVDYCPLQIESGSGQKKITQFDGKTFDDIGLMKFDFLGLANLSIIDNALNFIKQFKGKEIDIFNVPTDDKKTFELLQNGDTTAVFQLEGAGMRKYLKELKPENVEEISAMCALYRPGPIKFIPSYIDRKFGREEPEYLIPEIEDIMKITYGLPVYQEQILQIAGKVAGYTLGEADNLRRAIGKKLPDVMAAEEKKFIEGVTKNTEYGEDIARKLWEYAQPFADYGFNKAHSAVYAMVAYYTAYLKANYPTEFYAALMLSDIDNLDKLVRDIIEAESHGIKLLPPDINESDVYFKIEKEGVIRFGIGGLKGVGMKSIQHLVDERDQNGKFKSLDDLCDRIDHKIVAKGAIEALIKVGAMQGWGSRSGLLMIFEDVYIRSQKARQKKNEGFVDMFGNEDNNTVVTKIPEVEETDDNQKIIWETEIVGVPITPSLLSKLTHYMKYKGYKLLLEVLEMEEDKKVRIYGEIERTHVIQTKRGDEMCFLTVFDGTSRISVTVFTKLYTKVKDQIKDKEMVLVSGKTQKRNDEIQIIANNLKLVDQEKIKKSLANWKKKKYKEDKLDQSPETVNNDPEKTDKIAAGRPKSEESEAETPHVSKSINNESDSDRAPKHNEISENQYKTYKIILLEDLSSDNLDDFLQSLKSFQCDGLGHKVILVLADGDGGAKEIEGQKSYVDEIKNIKHDVIKQVQIL